MAGEGKKIINSTSEKKRRISMAFRESLKIQIKWHRRNLLLHIILISRLKWLKVINICNNIGIVRW